MYFTMPPPNTVVVCSPPNIPPSKDQIQEKIEWRLKNEVEAINGQDEKRLHPIPAKPNQAWIKRLRLADHPNYEEEEDDDDDDDEEDEDDEE